MQILCAHLPVSGCEDRAAGDAGSAALPNGRVRPSAEDISWTDPGRRMGAPLDTEAARCDRAGEPSRLRAPAPPLHARAVDHRHRVHNLHAPTTDAATLDVRTQALREQRETHGERARSHERCGAATHASSNLTEGAFAPRDGRWNAVPPAASRFVGVWYGWPCMAGAASHMVWRSLLPGYARPRLFLLPRGKHVYIRMAEMHVRQ